jgi:hypothetical protein
VPVAVILDVVKRERARSERVNRRQSLEPGGEGDLLSATTPALVACAAANRKKMMAPPVDV